MKKIENHHLKNTAVIINALNILQWMLKLGESLMRNGIIWIASKLSSSQIVTNFKGKKMLRLEWKKSVRHHLNQVIKVNITSKKHTNIICPLIWYTEEGRFSKIHNFNLITRKHQTNPIWETVYEIPGQYSSSMSRSRKTRNDWEIITDWRIVKSDN